MTIKFSRSLGKKEIAYNIKSVIGFSSTNIQKITNDIIDGITKTLISEKKVNIKNFGTFYIHYKKRREGRNPKTGEKFNINSRYIVKFKLSSYLKQRLNDN